VLYRDKCRVFVRFRAPLQHSRGTSTIVGEFISGLVMESLALV
jgi:hypothetical protein